MEKTEMCLRDINQLREALKGLLKSGLCDFCYEEGCFGNTESFCPCRGVCHDRIDVARGQASRILDKTIHYERMRP